MFGLCTRRILLLVLFLFVWGGWLTAQSDGSHHRRPSRMIAPRRGTKPLEKNGMPMTIAVVYDDVKVNSKVTLDIWRPYYVYAASDTHYYLGMPAPRSLNLALINRLGWVEKRYVLDSSDALRTPNKIYRRIIVFDNQYDKRVPIFQSPRNTAPERSKTPMYTFFYVYKESGDYYLIGLAPRVDLEYSGDDLLGWIHKKSCREWNSRLAISYREETREQRLQREQKGQNGLVRVYKDLAGAKAQNSEKIIAKESDISIWRYNMPRYPLLESIPSEKSRLFQIAFLGGQKSDIVQRSISRIKEEKDKLSRLDVMLVVDSSLKKWVRQELISSVKSANQYLRQHEADKDRVKLDIAWGVTFYNDFRKGRRYRYRRGRLFEPTVVHIHPLTTNIEQFVTTIETENYHGEPAEPRALLYVLDMLSHRKVSWRQGSSRCVFVIGTGGNHPYDSKDNVARIKPMQVQLPLQRLRLRLYAVHLLDKTTELPPTYKAFYEQLSALAGNMQAGGYFPIYLDRDVHERSQPSVPPYEWYFDKLLVRLLSQYSREIKVFQDTLSDLQRGFPPKELSERHQKDWDKIWQDLHREIDRASKSVEMLYRQQGVQVVLQTPSMASLLEEFISMHGIRVKDLKGEGGFFERGWVWEYNPRTQLQQLQVCLLIDQLELGRLIGFLSSLQMELQRASKPEQYVEVWKTLLKTSFGIDTIPPNEPLDNLVKQRTGLPFLNGLLSYTLDDFVKRARNTQFRRNIIEKLQVTCNRLFLILEEKEVEKETLPDGQLTTVKKKRWWVEESSMMKYSWIEIEIFP